MAEKDDNFIGIEDVKTIDETEEYLPIRCIRNQNSLHSDRPKLPSEGLLAYFPFDGHAYDESGNGHQGKIYGAVSVTDRKNNAGKALYFNGNSDYVLVKPAIINKNTSFTICTWIKAEIFKNPNMGLIWERAENATDFCGNYSSGNWAIEMYSDKVCHDIATLDNNGNCNWTRFFCEEKLIPGKWYFITSVYDKDNRSFKLYLNARLVSSKTVNQNLQVWEGAVTRIGRNCNQAPQSWQGCIDDIRIYNRALYENEIQQLFNE
jgi:hypothetical protein